MRALLFLALFSTAALHAVALKRQEILEQAARFDFYRLDLVGYVPSLVLFDARGRDVFRTEAYLRPFHIAGALDYVSSGGYTREPSFQRFLQAKAERMKSRGARVDLWD